MKMLNLGAEVRRLGVEVSKDATQRFRTISSTSQSNIPPCLGAARCPGTKTIRKSRNQASGVYSLRDHGLKLNLISTSLC